MKKLLVYFLLLGFSTSPVLAGVTQSVSEVFFNTAAYQLTDNAQQTLLKVIEEAGVLYDYEILISGYTDDIGNVVYNRTLSEQRAQAVEAFFINNGANPDHIKVLAYGEEHPNVPNVSDKNRQVNRRVDVLLKNYHFSNIGDLEKELLPVQEQAFIVDPAKTTVLEGKRGTKILLKAGALQYEDGSPVDESINLILVEALSLTEFVGNNLGTLSNGKLLESGGMLKLEARTASGKKVMVRESDPLVVTVPTSQQQEGMQVFYAARGNNWIPANQQVQMTIPLNLPPKPKFDFHYPLLPEYKANRSDFPNLPTAPNEPTPPNAPRQLNYDHAIKWYHFFTKKKIRNKWEARQTAIDERYEQNLEKYEADLEAFHHAEKRYAQALVAYEEASKAWYKENERKRKFFSQSPEYQLKKTMYDKMYFEAKKGYEAELTAWKEMEQAAIKEQGVQMKLLGLEANQKGQYTFTVNQLKWINIDRFSKMDMGERRQVVVKDQDKDQERVMIIFHDINSLLNVPQFDDNAYLQKSVPKRAKATLFAYKVVDGKAMMFHAPLTKENVYAMEFKACKFNDIKSFLETFQKS